jgi:SpoVK/Ycf46/Vps4 family AAA+-type ATPase
MLRPGRLGKLLYVPLPSSGDRASILSAVSRYYIEYNSARNATSSCITSNLKFINTFIPPRKVTIDKDDVSFESIAQDPRAEGIHSLLIIHKAKI